MLAIVGGVGSGMAYAEAAAPMKKCIGCLHSWVCQYVNEPGEPERLVPGDQNPMALDNYFLVGDSFPRSPPSEP